VKLMRSSPSRLGTVRPNFGRQSARQLTSLGGARPYVSTERKPHCIADMASMRAQCRSRPGSQATDEPTSVFSRHRARSQPDLSHRMQQIRNCWPPPRISTYHAIGSGSEVVSQPSVWSAPVGDDLGARFARVGVCRPRSWRVTCWFGSAGASDPSHAGWSVAGSQEAAARHGVAAVGALRWPTSRRRRAGWPR
jgi:hypothetical protein